MYGIKSPVSNWGKVEYNKDNTCLHAGEHENSFLRWKLL